MRVAVVIVPPGTEDSPASALAQRLEQAGYRVTRVTPSIDLAEEISRALGDGRGATVLMYVAGALRPSGDESVALKIDDTDVALRLDAVGRLVQERAPLDGLFVLDVTHDGDDDAFLAAEYVDNAVRAIRREVPFGVLIGARASSRPEARPWEFTERVVQALDDPRARDPQGGVPISRLYERLRGQHGLSASVPSFAHVRGPTDFILLPPVEEMAPPTSRTLDLPRESVPESPRTPRPPRSAPAAPVSAPPSSGPPLDVLLAEADDLRSTGAWDDALLGYRKALMLHGAREGQPRAEVYHRIGEVKLAQDKPREAELNFEKALDAHPVHRASYDALVLLATKAQDWTRLVALRRKIREALGDASQLPLIAELLEEKLHNARGALEALEEAYAHLPGEVRVLERLRALYERMQRWPKVVEIVGELCREAPDGTSRSELRFAQADVTLGRLRDETRGLSFLEAAMEEDPANDKALQALVAVRTRRGEWDSLERTYARLIDRHAERGDVARAWDVCRRLGLLRRDQLRDLPGALDALEGAIRCKPSDVETHAAVADLRASRGDLDGALKDLEQMAESAPTRVATHRKLYDLHIRRGEVDRAWLAATALEELGSPDMDHQLLIDQFRPERSSAIRPATALDDATYETLLCAPGADRDIAALLRAVARPAAALRVQALRAQKKLLSMRPEKRQSPESTVSIVRTFSWASQILGVPLPELYVHDDVPGGIAAVPGDTRVTAIGPAVLSGLPLRELAFLVARHLVYYRPENYPLVFFPSLPDLTTLFVACLGISLKKISTPPAAFKLRAEMEKHLAPVEKEELARSVERLERRAGQVDLGAWIRGVELTATRSGLLLAGDLAVAMRVMRSESRRIADLSVDDKRVDLLSWCASPKLSLLRDRLGIAAQAVPDS